MKVLSDVDISTFSYWKIGGKVKNIYFVNNILELTQLVTVLKMNGVKFLVLGRLTNILITTENIDGAIIFLKGDFIRHEIIDGTLIVGAGAYVPATVRDVLLKSYTGIEHLIGIPASFGGIVVMNGGSLRQSISQRLLKVTSLNVDGEIIVRNNEQCLFGYRESIFKLNSDIILSVTIKLDSHEEGYKTTRRNALDILRSRRHKFPRKLPNCGSVFKSCPRLFELYGPPGKVIEDIGLKGFSLGGAQISNDHANFIINLGGANHMDVMQIIFHVMKTVQRETGILLEPEVLFLDKNLNLHNIFDLYHSDNSFI